MRQFDLTTAGGRLQYSIEVITRGSFFDFTKSCKSMNGRNLYYWITKKELSEAKLLPLLEDLPELPIDYIIHNDFSKKPISNSELILKENDQSINIKYIKLLEKRVSELEKISDDHEKIIDLLEQCLEELKGGRDIPRSG